MKQRVSDREWHGKENPRSRYAVTNPVVATWVLRRMIVQIFVMYKS